MMQRPQLPPNEIPQQGRPANLGSVLISFMRILAFILRFTVALLKAIPSGYVTVTVLTHLAPLGYLHTP